MAQLHQSPPSVLKIALIQLHPKLLGPEHNFEAAEQYIRTAALRGASLAVLPEYHLTGWAPQDPLFRTIASRADEYISRYKALARELQINIVPGTIVSTRPASPTQTSEQGDEEAQPALLNTATFISASGDILGEYTKTNLWHPEREYLTSGACSTANSTHSIIDTPLGPVGLLICYDLFFPEAFRALIRAGARIIIIPTFTKADDLSAEGLAINANAEALFIRSAVVTRAFENECCVVFVNAGGSEKEGFVGLSRVALPILGEVAGSFESAEEGVRVVEVDLEILGAAERNYRIRTDLGKKDFHYR